MGTSFNERVAVTSRRVETEESESFYQLLPGAFAYPFKGDGVIILMVGAFVFTFAHFVQRFTGFLGLMIGVATAGYMFSFLKQIITSTVQGSNQTPDWPDLSNWLEDLVQPFGQMIALLVLAFGPALILEIWKPFGTDYTGLAVLIALAAGALLAPMGMLALAVLDNVGALNPVALVLSIFRIPLPYFVATAVFETVLVLYAVFSHFAASLGIEWPLSDVAQLVLNAVELCALAIGMRVLGLLYRTHQDRLGWA